VISASISGLRVNKFNHKFGKTIYGLYGCQVQVPTDLSRFIFTLNEFVFISRFEFHPISKTGWFTSIRLLVHHEFCVFKSILSVFIYNVCFFVFLAKNCLTTTERWLFG